MTISENKQEKGHAFNFDIKALLALAATLIFWASAFAGIRTGLVAYSPGAMALLRFLVASLALAFIAVPFGVRLPARRDIPALTALGFIGITVYHVGLNYGEVTVTAGAASLIINCSPIFAALLATAFLGDHLRIWGWVGIMISFAGIAVITLGEGQALSFEPGAAFVLVAAIGSSLYIVLQKPFLSRYTALEFACYVIWAGTVFMLPFLPQMLQEVVSAPLEPTLAVVYLGIFPAAIAYVTWSYTLARAPIARAASTLFISPSLAILIAWGWLGEVPSLISLLGGGLSIAGIILVTKWGRC